MVIQVGNKSICLNRFIEDILYHEGFQISNTVKDNWVVATKKIYGLPNASYIVQGKYPTRVITKKQYNGRMEIYMNNGWQVTAFPVLIMRIVRKDNKQIVRVDM